MMSDYERKMLTSIMQLIDYVIIHNLIGALNELDVIKQHIIDEDNHIRTLQALDYEED